MGEATVVRAVVNDAPVVADLQIRLWQQAYSEILPTALLLADPVAQAERWAARIEAGPGVWIGYEGGDPVGFATAGFDDAERGEIEVLGVLPRWARRGHGGRLLGTAVTELRGLGATEGFWWAPDSDQSIERFLAGVGWLPDGRRTLDTGEGMLTEIRYSGSLDLVLV